MRRSRTALIGAVALMALSATIVPARRMLGQVAPPALDASRGARYLLRNGLDYLDKYHDHGRAAIYLRAAESRQAELNEAERRSLVRALEVIRRGPPPVEALARSEPAVTMRGPGALAPARPQPIVEPPSIDPVAPLVVAVPEDLPRLPDEPPPPDPLHDVAVTQAQAPAPAPTAVPTERTPSALPPLPGEAGEAPAPPAPLGTAPDPLPAPIVEPPPPPDAAAIAPPVIAPPPIEPEAPAAPVRRSSEVTMPPPEPEPEPESELAPAPAPAAAADSAEPGSTLPEDLRREVQEVARRLKQEAERRRAGQGFTPEGATGGETDPSTPQLELPRPPSPTEARPLRAIPVPEDFVPLQPRQWEPSRKSWAAPATCSAPLYFQDPVLERYGQGVEQALGPLGRCASYPLDDPTQSNQRNQVLQPFASIGLFAAQVATWPYKLVVDPPWEAEYDLGYYRPGDRIAPDTVYRPWHGLGPPGHGRNY